MPGPPCFAALLLMSCLVGVTGAAEVRVAVAANFATTLHALAGDFSAATGHRLQVSSGSTGKHYAQIRNGAAFDVFLAADSARPARLEAEGVGVAGSRFTYAVGRLALWVPGESAPDPAERYLQTSASGRFAIANPRLAPYGQAARQVLQGWGLWDRLQGRLVRGENAAQAFQFVATGNAPAGLVALSQLRTAGAPEDEFRLIPESLHEPIRQQALLLRPGAAAEAFLRYLRTDAVAAIAAAGYRVPAAR